MPTYIVISDWTQQGVAEFKDTVERFESGKGAFEELGVNFKDIYWTLGQHDMVSIVEAPDDETLAAAALKQTAKGNFRTTTLRAFSADEMKAVLAKAG